LPLLAALIPLLTLPGVLFYFDITPKVALLLLGAACACCLPRRRPIDRRLLLVFAAMAFTLVIAGLGSSNPWLSISGGNWRRYGVVTQLAVLVFALLAAVEGPLLPALRSIAASSILVAAYTILQYFGWDPLLPAAGYHVGEGEWTIVRPPSTIGHANYLGSYLCFSVLLSVLLWRREQSRRWRNVAAVTIGTGSLAIVLCGSRAAVAGALAGALILLYVIRPRARTVMTAAALGVVLLTGFYFSPWGLKLRGRMRWYREDAVGGARTMMWRDSMRMALARPLAGWGPETFNTEFPKYQSLELARSYPDFYHESPHNVFVDELTAKGILGLAAFGLLCVLALRRPLNELSAVLVAALVNLQFTALVVSSAFFFYWIAAMLIAGEAGGEPRRRSLALAIGVPPALVFAVCAFRLVLADYHLGQTRQALNRADAPAAIARYESVRRWQLPGVSSDLYYSRALQQITRVQRDLPTAVKALQEAVQAGIRATQFAEDRANAFYSLANIYAVMNNSKDTEFSLRQAIQAAPNWYKPHWMLARMLSVQGRRAEAHAEADAAVNLGGGKHPEVRETLRLLAVPK
jgi:O-antigen ligase